MRRWYERATVLPSPAGTDALALSRGLRAARELWQAGERSAGRLRDAVAGVLASVDGSHPIAAHASRMTARAPLSVRKIG